MPFRFLIVLMCWGSSVPLFAQSGTFSISAPDRIATQSTFTVSALLEADTTVGAISMSVRHDSDVLQIVDVQLGAALDPLLGGVAPESMVINFPISAAPGVGGWAGGFILPVGGPFVPATIEPVEIVQIEYSGISENGGTTDLEYDSSLVIADNCYIVGGTLVEVKPPLLGASVEIVAPFLRGDVNGDGDFSLIDLFLLFEVLFSGLTVDCAAALDLNDDQMLTLTDVITGLQFELSLIPALPSPHPFCGSDLTGLDCVDADCP